jgi:hypothetical protein
MMMRVSFSEAVLKVLFSVLIACLALTPNPSPSGNPLAGGERAIADDLIRYFAGEGFTPHFQNSLSSLKAHGFASPLTDSPARDILFIIKCQTISQRRCEVFSFARRGKGSFCGDYNSRFQNRSHH